MITVLYNGVHPLKELAVPYGTRLYPIYFRRRIVEKWVKQMPVGGALFTLGGIVATEDEMGRRTYHDVGLFWDPRKSETGRTVEAKNHVSIQGDPGPKIEIRVFSVSLKEHKVLDEIHPSFVNERKGIKVWEYEIPLVVFIDGERQAENWTLSHWRMFSGMVVFDVAKNKFRREGVTAVAEDHCNGEDSDPNDIAGAQVDHGKAKNGRV
jgi:hypothetical protein